MQPNNRDDLARTISRLVDDLISEMVAQDGSMILSFIILAAGTDDPPVAIRMLQEDHPAIRYEVVEGEGKVYITALLPPGNDPGPSVTFQPLHVEISFEGETTVVNLPSRIDVRVCHCKVKNRVLDITCEKE